MAEGRSRQLWDHTAELLAMLANAHCRAAGQGQYSARDFHPYYEAPGPEQLTPAQSMAVLKRWSAERTGGRGG